MKNSNETIYFPWPDFSYCGDESQIKRKKTHTDIIIIIIQIIQNGQ